VQAIPIADRVILDAKDAGASSAEQVSRMASRMQAVGRGAISKSDHGNSTKRIRLQLAADILSEGILATIKSIPARKDFRSEERLPVSELEKVTPEHLFVAVQRLLEGHTDHGFGDSTDYDVLFEDGSRLAPKAVFGLAASEALGYPVGPRNFAAGLDSPCFRILGDAGYQVVAKGEATAIQPGLDRTDLEWSEGTPKLRKHLHRERSASLREAKKAEFRRKHDGRLFCERCGEDPVETYKTEDAEACIEVHHERVQVSEMQDGHRTRLEDLQCLCANCHRLAHRQIRQADAPRAEER
jgi:5-methylcytosine-specific restriction protein A